MAAENAPHTITALKMYTDLKTQLDGVTAYLVAFAHVIDVCG